MLGSTQEMTITRLLTSDKPNGLRHALTQVAQKRRTKEWLIHLVLFVAALISVAVTTGIVVVLMSESLPAIKTIGLSNLLLDTQWTPLFADAHYGLLPLICGTFVVALIALAVAVPVGTAAAVYLSEYAGLRSRELIKPALELLSAVPTVVYGYFALFFLTPILQVVMPDLPGFNMLSAGLVMGVMIVPYVCSLSDDAMRAVPMSLREGSYAMGATRVQTALQVVFPGALSGITAAYILAVSRAIGETMVVSIAAGMQPNLSLDPREPAQTLTAYIVQVSLGDLPHGSIGYQTIFIAGLCLGLITLSLNVAGHIIRRRFREEY